MLNKQKIQKACDNARKRVSKMNREERQKLLKYGLKIINSGKYGSQKEKTS